VPNLVGYEAHCVKVVDKAITMDYLRLLRPRYKYSITTRCKLCGRFIHSRLDAQYLSNCGQWSNLLKEIGSLFGILKYVCDIVVKKFTFAISSPNEFLSDMSTFYT